MSFITLQICRIQAQKLLLGFGWSYCDQKLSKLLLKLNHWSITVVQKYTRTVQ